MSYAATTDFLALVRKTSGGARIAQFPGLDFVISALNRANLYKLWTGATAPVVDQDVTVWLRPSFPMSWAAEGAVWLFNATAGEYQLATPTLWGAFLLRIVGPVIPTYVLQIVTDPTATVGDTTTIIVVERDAPAATAIALPTVDSRMGQPLRIADWSTNVTDHGILITAAGSDTIMRLGHYTVFSTADGLSGVTLQPVTELQGWIIAP